MWIFIPLLGLAAWGLSRLSNKVEDAGKLEPLITNVALSNISLSGITIKPELKIINSRKSVFNIARIVGAVQLNGANIGELNAGAFTIPAGGSKSAYIPVDINNVALALNAYPLYNAWKNNEPIRITIKGTIHSEGIQIPLNYDKVIRAGK